MGAVERQTELSLGHGAGALDTASRRMAAASAVPIAHTEGPRECVRYANEALAALVGRPVAALLGQPLVRLLGGDEPLEALIKQARGDQAPHCAAGVAYIGAGNRPHQGTFFVAPLLDADEPPGQLLVQVGDTGNERLFASEVREANELLLIASVREQELAERANRGAAELKAILDNMDEGVTVFDAAGQTLIVNPKGRAILGFDENDTSSEAYRSFRMSREDGSEVDFDRDLLGPLLAGKSFSDLALLLRRPDGRERHVVMSGSVVRGGGGEVVQAVKVYRDVSELHHLEQTRQLYFSLISHDLRGPLSAASITATVLQRHCAGDEQSQQYTSRILRNLERIDEMVRDLLDAQRVRAGERLPLKLEEHDLADIVLDVVADLTTLHGERFELQGKTSLRGVWSGSELRRAIWNLASNGVKYGAPDAPVVMSIDTDGERVALSVHNEGPAIPPESVDRLFVPFARSSAAVTTKRGWGLGLTLVRGCAEAHGGRVTVHSSAVEGTTFTLELPLDARPFVEG
jgi:PAS domain S-box-containing protein